MMRSVLEKCKGRREPKQFRKLVQESGLSQSRVADLLGVSQATVSQMMHGNAPIRTAYVFTLHAYIQDVQ